MDHRAPRGAGQSLSQHSAHAGPALQHAHASGDLKASAPSGKIKSRLFQGNAILRVAFSLSSGGRVADAVFRALGLSQEEAQQKFGFLLDAFRYGAPPHGGMGIGLDRLVMQMVGASTLRDVIAYPKVQNMTEPMTDCPSVVDDQQLLDLGIALRTE
ncbi:MAG: hypothetical protein IIV17_03260 [Clostridia bacterium]|nr:hypothetical protein [Clostridia bacterium]